MQFNGESLVTSFFTIAIVVTNTLVLLVIAWTEALRNINKVFLTSLTLADLCVGIFITPFAVYSTFSNSWIYDDQKFCHFVAYLLAIFFIAGVYSLSWISVDHYLAIRKPQRHKTAMTPTRSLCWIAFAWLAAVSFCSPPLFTERASYYPELFMCSIDAGPQKPYFITAGILVMFPAVLALMFTNAYLFTKSFSKKRLMYETILIDTATRPRNYFMNFLISIIFVIVWLPWFVLQAYGAFVEDLKYYPHKVHFYLLWLAIGNSSYKFILYVSMSADFRRGLRQLCSRRDCRCPDCTMPENISINFVTVHSSK